jgi:hypothetical protein
MLSSLLQVLCLEKLFNGCPKDGFKGLLLTLKTDQETQNNKIRDFYNRMSYNSGAHSESKMG